MKAGKEQTQAFTNLINEHHKLIYKVCGLYTATEEQYKDLYQDIVLQAWSAYPRFRQESKVSTWLYRIALNTALIYKKKEGRIKVLKQVEYQEITADDENNEAYKMLWHLIKELPELERALILLYLDNNSYEEIAVIMGISVSNTGTRLARIREKLKIQVAKMQSSETWKQT